ncbi:MAG: 50S ribosomal protein L13 [Candidatus Buchananbacteria bacterium]|nr:50S ribosomal protein L13 [Candidatus Buchananbacteria bacterium]
MTTTNFKVKIDRKNHQIDATDQAIGRLATQIAALLRGKHKPNYAPQVDNGDFVVVTNIDKVRFTGKKIEQKKYYRYSGYPGGLKTTKLKKIFNESPQEVLKKAVYNMLPKNKLRQHIIKRLTFK